MNPLGSFVLIRFVIEPFLSWIFDLPKVIVVGGGVVGCAVARALNRVGATVRLFEANECGSGASWAAAGMLSPHGEVSTPGPFQELAVASMADFGEFVKELEYETDRGLGFARSGKIELGHSSERATHIRTLAERLEEAGVEAYLVEPSALESLEPHIDGEHVTAALHVPSDAHVDNRALAHALAEACVRAGVDVLEHSPVAKLIVRNGQCEGVETSDGVQHAADLVVLAAGWQSGSIRGLPRTLPVEPILGEMIAYRAVGQLTRMVHTEAVYIIQRGSRVLVGATMESGHAAARISDAARCTLVAGARAVLPTLPDAPYEQWAGLRPSTPDGLPFLGPDPDVTGLAYACGHFRNGILLAPATAAWAPMLIAQPPSSGRLRVIDWEAFRVDRQIS